MPRKGGVPENLRPPVKGERRNPKGRPKLPDIKEALAKILAEEKDGVNALEAILKSMRAKAAKGDVRAADFLITRGYGKADQRIEIDGQMPTTIIHIIPDTKSHPIV
jgi:hypothetical protein